jgi:hypothetical protein
MNSVRRLAYALIVAILPCALVAQEPTGTGTGTAQEGGFGGRGGRAPEPEIRPYDRVITKDAKSDEGIFTVHRIKDRIYYEIPKERLGREFLWVSQIAKTTLGAGYGGQAAGNRVVKWERRADRILLRAVSYDVIADPSTPIAKAVGAANYNPIVMAFNIPREAHAGAALRRSRRLLLHRQDRLRQGRASRSAAPLHHPMAAGKEGSERRPLGAGEADRLHYRRNLQRAYVDTLSSRINGPQAQSDDARAFFRGELKTLDADLATALGRQVDRATSLHIQDVRTQIARALDPTVQATSAPGRSSTDLDDESLFDVNGGGRSVLARLRRGSARKEVRRRAHASAA